MEADDEGRYAIRLGPLGATPPFSPRQWKVFGIAITAGFFDQYDRALLSLALKQIQKGLKIAEASLGSMLSAIRLGFALSLFVTPLADVFGRRRLLLYTIVGYTIFTGLSAIAPGARSFVAAQVLARAFAGAEATIALVILVEEVDAANRGWAVGLLAAIASCGDAMAAVAFVAINLIPYGWRGLYAIALAPLILLIPLRRLLPESRRFEAESRAHAVPAGVWEPIRELVRAYPRRLIMMLAIAFLAALGGNPGGFFFPKFLQEVYGFSPFGVTAIYLVGGGLGILGNVVAGRLSDRFGRRSMGTLFNLLAPILVILGYRLKMPRMTLAAAWTIAIFTYTAGATILAAYSAELFPTSYRSTAGAALGVAGTFGGAIGLFLESVLYRATHSHWTALSYLAGFWMLAPLIIIMLPETAGRELEAISADEN
ncbi:MAG TPA: MFS transporter [Candidatus Binataceae bacterium]|nr:MFS transporter [Candidatus Binataceae bacterium]